MKVYVILCDYYRTGENWLRWGLKEYKNALNIRQVDLRRLIVKLMNGDEVHYVPKYRFEQWSIGRRDWTVISSLGELAERKEE